MRIAPSCWHAALWRWTYNVELLLERLWRLAARQQGPAAVGLAERPLTTPFVNPFQLIMIHGARVAPSTVRTRVSCCSGTKQCRGNSAGTQVPLPLRWWDQA